MNKISNESQQTISTKSDSAPYLCYSEVIHSTFLLYPISCPCTTCTVAQRDTFQAILCTEKFVDYDCVSKTYLFAQGLNLSTMFVKLNTLSIVFGRWYTSCSIHCICFIWLLEVCAKFWKRFMVSVVLLIFRKIFYSPLETHLLFLTNYNFASLATLGLRVKRRIQDVETCYFEWLVVLKANK